MGGAARRWGFAGALVAGALLLLALERYVVHGPGPGAAEAPPLPGRARLSLLALGDTGDDPWILLRGLALQRRVGRALAAEDLVRPVDALLLLGDQFYPDGLRATELEARVRANLVEPYCRFLAVAPASAPRLGTRCPDPVRPLPVYAVLGNHDHGSPESARLQREVLPVHLPGWRLPAAPVEGVALAPGVSLVLYDPRELAERGDFEPLRAALAAAPGPWRLAASHYPLDERPPGRLAREALAAAGVPVHLHLAGHRHALELAAGAPPPFLQVVSGAGSDPRAPKRPLDGARFQSLDPGFARIDLVEAAGAERLVVSLVALEGGLGGVRTAPRVVARVSMDAAGAVRDEPLEVSR